MFPYSLTLRAHAEAVRPCFLRKRPHGKDGYESHCWIRSIVLVFRIERMTGFEPAVSCLGSRRATTAPHPRCEGWDSNPRPPGYEPGELPSCSTPHGRAFFSDTPHGGDVLSAGRKEDGRLPSERPGLARRMGLGYLRSPTLFDPSCQWSRMC